jgi:hypothetical protein
VFFADGVGERNEQALAEWQDEHRPDAVLCDGNAMPSSLCVRSGIPWVELQGTPNGGEAWIDAGAGEIAAAAVDCVVEKMRRFERGVRDATRLHLVKGAWHDRVLAERELQPVVA